MPNIANNSTNFNQSDNAMISKVLLPNGGAGIPVINPFYNVSSVAANQLQNGTKTISDYSHVLGNAINLLQMMRQVAYKNNQFNDDFLERFNFDAILIWLDDSTSEYSRKGFRLYQDFDGSSFISITNQPEIWFANYDTYMIDISIAHRLWIKDNDEEWSNGLNMMAYKSLNKR